MSTFTALAWLSTFIRVSSIVPADCWPGTANQKSVPGLPQLAVTTPPAEVCSASRPCAIVPVAWIITPPGWTTAAFFAVPPGLAVPPAAAGTPATDWAPGCDSVPTGLAALPGEDSLLITARPAPGCPAAASTASPVLRLPVAPGAGQARAPTLTGTLRGATVCWPAETVTGLLSQATPASAPSASTTSAKTVNLFAEGILTSRRPATG